MNGILLFRKPILWTSHDAVDFVRRKIGQKDVGHAGTLDPLATGLLLILIGSATKLSACLAALDKDYSGVLTLGVSTDTQDLEGRITDTNDVPALDEERVRETFVGFTGKQLQTPPAFSAVRQKGKKLYELARRGVAANVPPREVTVSSIRMTRFEPPDIHFFLTCSKGVYVRTLCDLIGKRLGCGGTLSALVRERVGPFGLASAMTCGEVNQSSAPFLERSLTTFNVPTNECLSRP